MATLSQVDVPSWAADEVALRKTLKHVPGKLKAKLRSLFTRETTRKLKACSTAPDTEDASWTFGPDVPRGNRFYDQIVARFSFDVSQHQPNPRSTSNSCVWYSNLSPRIARPAASFEAPRPDLLNSLLYSSNSNSSYCRGMASTTDPPSSLQSALSIRRQEHLQTTLSRKTVSSAGATKGACRENPRRPTSTASVLVAPSFSCGSSACSGGGRVSRCSVCSSGFACLSNTPGSSLVDFYTDVPLVGGSSTDGDIAVTSQAGPRRSVHDSGCGPANQPPKAGGCTSPAGIRAPASPVLRRSSYVGYGLMSPSSSRKDMSAAYTAASASNSRRYLAASLRVAVPGPLEQQGQQQQWRHQRLESQGAEGVLKSARTGVAAPGEEGRSGGGGDGGSGGGSGSSQEEDDMEDDGFRGTMHLI